MIRKIVWLTAQHFLPSLVIGAGASLAFKDPILIVFALLTGWLIDADHLLDLLVARIRSPGGLSAFESVATGAYFRRGAKIIVFLHSWELIAAWVLAWSCAGRGDIAAVGGVSWATHLAIDHASYRLHPWAYSLVYRAEHRFDFSAACLDGRG